MAAILSRGGGGGNVTPSIYTEYLTLLLVRARQCLAPQAMARTGSATHTRPNTVGSPSCDGSESEFESESEPESESGRPS